MISIFVSETELHKKNNAQINVQTVMEPKPVTIYIYTHITVGNK
jgi:hypothetical protein